MQAFFFRINPAQAAPMLVFSSEPVSRPASFVGFSMASRQEPTKAEPRILFGERASKQARATCLAVLRNYCSDSGCARDDLVLGLS
jgi:hypothetical protein